MWRARAWVVIVLCGLLAACTAVKSDNRAVGSAVVPPPEPYASRGVINYCSAFTNPPRVYQQDGRNVGVEVELATKMAEQLGLRINWVQYESAGLIPGLLGKRCDMLVDEFAYRADREALSWWLPNSYAVTQVVVPGGNPGKVTGFGDFPGRKVAAPDGSLAQRMLFSYNEWLAANGRPKVDVITLANTRDMFQQIAAGTLDAAVATDSSSAYYSKLAEGRVQLAGEPCTSGTTVDDRVGFLLRKEDKPLFDAMGKALDNLRANGSYNEIFTRFGMASVTLKKWEGRRPARCLPAEVKIA